MKQIRIGTLVTGFMIAFMFSIVLNSGAQDSSGSGTVIYKPPLRGAPGNRQGAGTRGEGKDAILLYALVPNHTALTTQSQPVLYWYISKLPSQPVVFTLNDEKKQDKVIREVLKPRKAGIQQVNLSEYRVNLVPEQEYSWFIKIETDPNEPSKNIIAGGSIIRTEASKSLTDKLSKSAKPDLPNIYAAEGIWCDALAAISQLAETQPENKAFKDARISLLKQGELSEVAERLSHPVSDQ